MEAPPLLVNRISKRFGKREVLSDISFSLKPGSVFGLIGLNGIGKTTLIKIMLGLLASDGGEVSFLGQPISHAETRRKISYLPEKFAPSPFLCGKEFLSLTLSYYGKPLDIGAAREGAAALDLDPNALDQRVTRYSKGMGQKLGLLSALMIGAPLLVLDEPMSGLDPRSRIHLKEALKRFVSAGNTLFFSSHILSDIDEICDEIAVIHHRRILFFGTPSAFKQRYGHDSLERAFLKAISGAQ